jgi:hypothetical protein
MREFFYRLRKYLSFLRAYSPAHSAELRNEQEQLNRKSQALIEELTHLSHHFTLLFDANNDMQWLLSTGADISAVPLLRFVPVRIYLSRPGKVPLHELLFLVRKVFSKDFEGVLELPTESGSIIKRLWLKSRQKLLQHQVEERLTTALGIQYLDRPQAEASKLAAEGLATILGGLKDIPNATIQIGNILVAKRTLPNGECNVAARTLSPVELKKLEENRGLLQDPRRAFDFLEAH